MLVRSGGALKQGHKEHKGDQRFKDVFCLLRKSGNSTQYLLCFLMLSMWLWLFSLEQIIE